MSQQGTISKDMTWLQLPTQEHASKKKKLSMECGKIPEAPPQVKEAMAVEGAGIEGVTFLEICGH